MPESSMVLSGDEEHGSLDYHHVKASDNYPKRQLKPDNPNIDKPVPEISGESIEFLAKIKINDDENSIIALSNYRVVMKNSVGVSCFPVRMIDTVELPTNDSLIINGRNGVSFKVEFTSAQQCVVWSERLRKASQPVQRLDELFAFAFYSWRSEERGGGLSYKDRAFRTLSGSGYKLDIKEEALRLKFRLGKTWRVTDVNIMFALSSSYPRLHIVPSNVTDDDLREVAQFRGGGRFPSVVWRHPVNCCILARCSQPLTGLWNYADAHDEKLLDSFTASVIADRENKHEPVDLLSYPVGNKKCLLILDARTFTSAFGNRIRGGGMENIAKYYGAELVHQGLGNIHVLRRSLELVREVCKNSYTTVDKQWLTNIDGTYWLGHVSSIMASTLMVVNKLDMDEMSVVVHCTDGWDRTPQIIGLSMVMLDPHYRTIEGFQTLIELQWLQFGHKFADRSCQSEELAATEISPIFLVWLDCVWQLTRQFPCDFEFNESFLLHLAHHQYSTLFGTFLCNTQKEREAKGVIDRTYSLWAYLDDNADEHFTNLLFVKRNVVLRPQTSPRDLRFWSNMFLPHLNPLTSSCQPKEFSSITHHDSNTPSIDDSLNRSMSRTRSCEDIMAASFIESFGSIQRAKSFSRLDDSVTNFQDGAPPSSSSSHALQVNESESVDSVIAKINLFESDSVDGSRRGAASKEIMLDNPHIGCPELNQSYSENCEEGNELIEEKECSDSNFGNMAASTDTVTNSTSLRCEPYATTSDSSISPEFQETARIHSGSNGNLQSASSGFVENLSPDDGDGRKSAPLDRGNSETKISLNRSNSQPLESLNGAVDGEKTCPRLLDNNVPRESKSERCESTNGFIAKRRSTCGTPRRYRSSSNDSEDSVATVRMTMQPDSSTVNGVVGEDGLIVLTGDDQKRLRDVRSFYTKQAEKYEREIAQLKAVLAQQKRGNGRISSGLDENSENGSCSSSNAGRKPYPIRVSRRRSIQSPKNDKFSHEYSTSAESNVSVNSWDKIDERNIDELGENEASKFPWIPDDKAPFCLSCKSQFKFPFKRRHHCRKCGKVFCSSCSSNRMPVPENGEYQPVRVCHDCFLVLQMETKKPQVAAVPSLTKKPIYAKTPPDTKRNWGFPTRMPRI